MSVTVEVGDGGTITVDVDDHAAGGVDAEAARAMAAEATKLVRGATSGIANLAALPAASAHTAEVVKTDDGGVYESTGTAWVELVPPSGTYAPAALDVSGLPSGRFVGVVAGVAPTGGPYLAGDYAIDDTTPSVWVCTIAGSPGTWQEVSGGGGSAGVASFNTRTGAVTLAKADVTGTGLAAADVGAQPHDTDLDTIAALDSSTAGALATDGAGWIRKTYAQLKTALGLTKADVGLGNVDNTSDANKPVSTAQQAALDLLIPLSQKAAANGVATLGADSKIPSAQLPALAITDTFVVTSQAAMLALTAQRGDVAIRTDSTPNIAYILTVDDPTTLANWQALDPATTVTSVNGATGAVTITAAGLGALVATNNLSDIANATTARTNLGLGSAATQNKVAAGSAGVLDATDASTTNARTPTTHHTSHESGGTDVFTGVVPGSSFAPSGLIGATASSRYVGATASGAPASGTFAVGDFVIDQTGNVWICTAGGTPGTWQEVTGGSGSSIANWSASANAGAAMTLAGVANTVVRFDKTLNQACAITISLTDNQQIELILRQDATGNRTASWTGVDKWETPTGAAPTLATGATAVDRLYFERANGVVYGYHITARAASSDQALYGSGVDGNVTISSGTTTLSRPMYYDTLTIASGAILVANGYPVFCKTKITGGGRLTWNGAAAVNNTAGAGVSGSTIGGGGAGSGGGTAAGTAGGGAAGAIGGAGGAGGTGASGAGGASGAANAPSPLPAIDALPIAATGIGMIRNAITALAGGGGGGGGGGDTSQPGGGGGGGAGVGVLVAKTVDVSGGLTIEAQGGAGGAAVTGAGSTRGGGGGGGGGWLSVVCDDFTGLTSNLLVAGGAAGAGANSGPNGSAGSAGRLTLLINRG